MSKVKALYHIEFCTKERSMTIPSDYMADLYRYIWKEITDMHCRLIRIGGIQNHVHLLVDLHPSVSLAKLVQNVKGYSSGWLRSDSRFRDFNGWASEYYACTISPDCQDALVEYIKSQQRHHLGIPFDDELREMHRVAQVDFDERNMR